MNNPEPYTITKDDLESITDAEVAFSTTRLLPEWDQIPDEFKTSQGNKYTKLASDIFFGNELTGEIDLNEGIEPELLSRAVRAHLSSFQPKHEHKISGVAYMVSCLATVI